MAIIKIQIGQVLSGTISTFRGSYTESNGTVSIYFLAIIHTKIGQVISGAVSIRFLSIIHSQTGQVLNGTVSMNLVSNSTEPNEAGSKRHCINKSHENCR